jgi:hypothetical protein
VFQHKEIPLSMPTPVISDTDDIYAHVETTASVVPEATMSVVIPVETPVMSPLVLKSGEPKGWKGELEELQGTLDVIEGRVKILRESLKNLDSLD